MLTVDADQAVELPVDQLALIVLADLVRSDEWNAYNYGNKLAQNIGQGYARNSDALQAVSEAMQWLRAHGMVATKLEESSGNAIFVTRWGHDALKKKLGEIAAVSRVQDNLHPLLQHRVRRQFLLGEYENAIFVAMKAIEIRIRKLGGFGDEVIGADLVTKALKSGGPLADPTAPPGEVDGTMMLFRGAYAVLRNPSGHREVSFDDVTEASEAVMTASLLMRMLDRIEARLMASP